MESKSEGHPQQELDSSSEFDPAYTSGSEPEDLDDVPGFLAFLDKHAKPSQTFGDQAADLAAHSEYDLVSASKRLELFAQWRAKTKVEEEPKEGAVEEPKGQSKSTEPCTFPELVRDKWKPGLFYLNFKRQYRDSPAFKDPAYTEKEREGIYREYTRLKKKSPEERAALRPQGSGTASTVDFGVWQCFLD